ncbi:uncharacterized protein LOC110176047 [Drosophila serrata]|uniref:uncharacterized protein LOC110176047 n=1 Tax=Drosophila serrata TaxID=7274 RepID=UPI000A1D25C2|nr:uncharacterized protein LOC110176047 [Drosophila serrata]XP_020797920.1 uncharacterized protein LOC110176047 [Drosophila serrata]
MGSILSFLSRGANVANSDVALVPSTINPGRDNRIKRPYFVVNGVACYTSEQLEVELKKDESFRMRKVLDLIENEGDSTRPSTSSLEDTNTTDLLAEVVKNTVECKRMRQIAEKLEEMKVEIIHMEQKQGFMENLRNVQYKRPVFPINRLAKKIRNVRARQIINRIGEMFIKLQLEEEKKRNLDEGVCYTYFVSIKPTAGASNCAVELVGQTVEDVAEQPQNQLVSKEKGSVGERQ